MTRTGYGGHDIDGWIAQARAGDVAAFNRLVDHHQGLAYHIAFHLTGDADDALDCCQEAMLSAWRAMPRFQGDGAAFKRWLARIVTNASLDRRRHESRRRAGPLAADGDDPPGGAPLPDPGQSPEAYAERHDLRALLGRAMAHLTADHRAVLLLDQLGFDYAEMAGILDTEVGTVKSRLSRARAHMRQILTGGAALEPWAAVQRYGSEAHPS